MQCYIGEVVLVDVDRPALLERSVVRLPSVVPHHHDAQGQLDFFLLVAGRRLDEPIARGGPFVMNTNEEIRQAIADNKSGNF